MLEGVHSEASLTRRHTLPDYCRDLCVDLLEPCHFATIMKMPSTDSSVRTKNHVTSCDDSVSIQIDRVPAFTAGRQNSCQHRKQCCDQKPGAAAANAFRAIRSCSYACQRHGVSVTAGNSAARSREAKERQAQRLVQLCAELCRASQHPLGTKQLPETQHDPLSGYSTVQQYSAVQYSTA